MSRSKNNQPQVYRVLSVRQPWATALVTPAAPAAGVAVKPIENRTWRTCYRGLLLIHASAAAPNGDDYSDVAAGWLASAADLPPARNLPRGAIIGAVRLVAVASDDPANDLPPDEPLAADWLAACNAIGIDLSHWAYGP